MSGMNLLVTNINTSIVAMFKLLMLVLIRQLWRRSEMEILYYACREIIGHRGAMKDFAPVSAPQGSVIAFATSPGQSSKENVGTGHGYYTEALLKRYYSKIWL